MNVKPLLQRGVLYGFIAGVGTTVVIALVATALNFSVGLTATVLFFGTILALILLLGTPGIGPGPAVGEMQSQSMGLEGYVSNPTEGGGASRNPATVAAIVPSTHLEYVTYFLGLGIAATVLLAILLN